MRNHILGKDADKNRLFSARLGAQRVHSGRRRGGRRRRRGVGGRRLGRDREERETRGRTGGQTRDVSNLSNEILR